jgi:hypothetical protein
MELPEDLIPSNGNSDEYCPESECDSRSSGYGGIPEVAKNLCDTLGSEKKAGGESKRYNH